jgi:SecD/SecF fusion protein
VAGGIGIGLRGRDILGVDFRGGEAMTLTFDHKIPLTDIHQVATQAGISYVAPVYQTLLGDAKEKLKIETETGKGALVVDALKKQFPDAGLMLIGEAHIGASVSEAIQWNAMWSVLAALFGILIYVAFRFEMGYGVGAAVSTTLDALMAVGIFVLVGGQFSASMVAAVLMIIGYSINDKIVVFDRIREELILNPTMRLLDVINLSVNRTLSRTTLTSLTTFLASLALYIFGAGEICDFAFLFMLGIVIGTLSSIFVASPIFYWWHKGDRHHVEAREVLPRYEWDASSNAGR